MSKVIPEHKLPLIPLSSSLCYTEEELGGLHVPSMKQEDRTHLHERDEDDEEGRRAAGVAVRVVLSLPIIRQEFLRNHFDHSAMGWNWGMFFYLKTNLLAVLAETPPQ